MYKLMIKQHNVTGLKYLCITNRKDYMGYLGSGVEWKKHLKENGNDISTTLLYETDDYDDFVDWCHYYSNYYDVVSSNAWANLVPESGYNNNDGAPNVVLYWKNLDDNTKKEIITKRNKSIVDSHWTKGPNSDATKNKLSNRSKAHWHSMTNDEKVNNLNNLWKGRDRFFDEKTEKYQKWKSNISDTVKENLANTPREVLSEKNKKARLNTPKESAQRRKQKIQEVYKSGKHNALFERYSKERKGSGNPAAKPIIVEETEYGSIKNAMDELGLTRRVITNRINSNRWPNWKRK